jgi:predicted Zn-dependent protease
MKRWIPGRRNEDLEKRVDGLPRSNGVQSKKTKADREEMEAKMDVFEERLDKMDTTDSKANREKSEGLAVNQEVPNQEAAVGETIGAMKYQYGDRHLDIGRRRQPKKRTQGSGGSR